MSSFAVIDTETNNEHDVMSIGIIVADSNNFERIDSRYYILSLEVSKGGMYCDRIYHTSHKHKKGSKVGVLKDLERWLDFHSVNDLFAYNARFDKNLLPELNNYRWHDIMPIAASKKHNPYIPDYLPCNSKGRLVRGYGVEPMLRMMYDENYIETHIAILDARDELKIMKLLGHNIHFYPKMKNF